MEILCGIPLIRKASPLGRVIRDTENKKHVIRLPQYVSKLFDERTKSIRIRAYGGKEYRGIRTRRYMYVRDLNGPWLLYDNQMDPHQLRNLCNDPEYAQVRQELEKMLAQKLKETNDKFLSGPEYMAMWNYQWDKNDGPK